MKTKTTSTPIMPPLKYPPFNLHILPEDVLSWAATPRQIQLRVTHSQSCLLIDKITTEHRRTNALKYAELPEPILTKADTNNDYQLGIAALQNITDSNDRKGGSQEYWESPEGKSIKRDCATLIRALKILRAGGPGHVDRLGKV